ncbi:MAG TPA: hypothetical protein DCE41_33025, partial [Cytophagales bacterium]|nr:hypothetical protein [Cytophagales bacterium]
SADRTEGPALLQAISAQLSARSLGDAYEPRVRTVVRYLGTHTLDYEHMLETLSELVHLSSSRISHLFKQEVGISLKKYLLWCRLRATIQQHLHSSQDLLASLFQSGFHDQPHFSKAFKSMLGVNPSFAYNSRTVQGPGSEEA